MRDPRLEAMYRRLVKRHGVKKARRMIQEAKAQAANVDIVDQLVQEKAEEVRAMGEPPPAPDGVPEGSVFLRNISDQVELWRIP